MIRKNEREWCKGKRFVIMIESIKEKNDENRRKTMEIPFWKLEGIGNDFIVVKERDISMVEDESSFVKEVCHRRLGLGADGLMVVKESEVADVKMRYYNQDGSRADLCGNGLRCFAKYVYDQGIVSTKEFQVETSAGIKDIEITEGEPGEGITEIKILMGDYTLDFLRKRFSYDGMDFEASSCIMGVPHLVIWKDVLNLEEVSRVGPVFEKDPSFPQGTNVNFARVVDESFIEVITWERGCGKTLGCGTGVTAVAVLANELGKTHRRMAVKSPGGLLFIEITPIENKIFMTGPARKIGEGRYLPKQG